MAGLAIVALVVSIRESPDDRRTASFAGPGKRSSVRSPSPAGTSMADETGGPTTAITGWRLLCLGLYSCVTAAVVLAFATGAVSFACSAACGIAAGTVCSLLPAGQFGGQRPAGGTRLPSPEYRLTIFWIFWVMAYVYYHTAVKLTATCAEIPQCQQSLAPAMLLGGSAALDVTDLQWRFFRSHLPLLLPTAAAFVAASRFVRWSRPTGQPAAAGRSLWAYSLLNAAVLVVLFGGRGAVVMAAIAAGNYGLSWATLQLPSWAGSAATWGYGLAVLFANEWGGAALYEHVYEVVWLPSCFIQWNGLIPRWWIYWGPTMLRCLAFNHDLHWAHRARRSAAATNGDTAAAAAGGGAAGHALLVCPAKSSRQPPAEWSYGWRERAHPPLSCFSPLGYFAYIFYSPTLLAGPITPFNAFISHARVGQRSHSDFELLLYGLQLAGCIGLMELLSCLIPAFAIAEHLSHPAAAALGPLDLTLFAFILLKLVR